MSFKIKVSIQKNKTKKKHVVSLTPPEKHCAKHEEFALRVKYNLSSLFQSKKFGNTLLEGVSIRLT